VSFSSVRTHCRIFSNQSNFGKHARAALTLGSKECRKPGADAFEKKVTPDQPQEARSLSEFLKTECERDLNTYLIFSY
jgi:hypothetical protein